MIEDVLYCLSGVDGEYISVSQGDCRIDGTIGTRRAAVLNGPEAGTVLTRLAGEGTVET